MSSSSMPGLSQTSFMSNTRRYAPKRIIIGDTTLHEARKFHSDIKQASKLGPRSEIGSPWYKTTTKTANSMFDSIKETVSSYILKEDARSEDVMFSFDEQLHEAQNEFHLNDRFLHYWVLKGSLALLKKLMESWDPISRRLEVSRPDPCGATPIHLAFQYELFEIGHYLVERYPDVAILPFMHVGCGFEVVHEHNRDGPPLMPDYYDAYEDIIARVTTHLLSVGKESGHKEHLKRGSADMLFNDDEYMCQCDEALFSNMPFTGQNILHVCIVHRQPEQVRYLLEFFLEHEDALPGSLVKLLTERAIGRFFRLSGAFYFGELPLFLPHVPTTRPCLTLCSRTRPLLPPTW
jgi:hypothetical protein